MTPRPPARRARAAALLAPALGAIAALPACESYQRAPVDLTAHRQSWQDRLTATEPVSAFAQRLRAASTDTPETFDIADGLTPAEGEVLALFYNPDLRLARLRAGVALAEADTAGLWQDPEFGFDGAEILSPSGPFQYGVTLSLTLPISGRLAVEKARAGAAHEAELRKVVDAEWSVRAGVRRAWNAWFCARESVLVHSAIAAQSESLASLATRLESAGEMSRVEGRLFHVEHSGRQAQLAQARLAERQARRALLGAMGLAPDSVVELVGPPPAWGGELPQDPMAVLIQRNTLLAVMRAEYAVAEESLRLEVRRQFPDITIGSGYGSEDRDDRLLLGVSLPIPVLNANRGGIARARAERDVARAAAEVTFEGLAHELSGAVDAHGAAREQRVAYERAVVGLLDEQSREIARLGELGEVDALLVLTSLTGQGEAKARLLELELAERDAGVRVLELLGPAGEGLPAPAPAGEGGQGGSGDGVAAEGGS